MARLRSILQTANRDVRDDRKHGGPSESSRRCRFNDQGAQETSAGPIAVVREVSNAGCPEKSEKQISAMMAMSRPAVAKSRKVSSDQ